MSHSEPIAREGWPFIIFFGLLTLVLYLLALNAAAILGLLLTGFCLFFFRNPERKIPAEYGSVVAPADGRIMDIMTMTENEYLHTDSIRIRIFLNLFNVHVNRAPLPGRVEWVKKVPGIYLAAYKDEAGLLNARNYVGMDTFWGKILVVQITGLIARRLVCWTQPGDILETGQRFGLIRFGSCTEIYLPVGTEILVSPGQKVKGGESLIARFS